MAIYDCFSYLDEDLLLDLRLNILNQYVDYFVIVEGDKTWQNNSKKLKFKLDNFQKFKDKIIYIPVKDMPEGDNPYKRENHQRNAISQGLKNASDEDIIIVSDLDEIPNPKKLKPQSMNGFETQYKNIIDYIVRITHTIWEEKNIGYIYDTYSPDCIVWDEFGLQSGSEKIVSDTIHTNNAFPDIRLFADEVIWAGNEKTSFHTSHRTIITGTNTGFSKFSKPTGKSVRLFCIANCVAKNNEIYYENVVYDTAGLIKQLGLDLHEVAKQIANEGVRGPFAPDFKKTKPKRKMSKLKPIRYEIPNNIKNLREFVHAVYDTI